MSTYQSITKMLSDKKKNVKKKTWVCTVTGKVYDEALMMWIIFL